MTKRTFPNPLLAALFLTALLTATAFAQNEHIVVKYGTAATDTILVEIEEDEDDKKFYIKSSELPKFAALIADKGAACYDIKELTKTSETPIAKEDIPTTAFTNEDEWTVAWDKKACYAIVVKYGTAATDTILVEIEEDDDDSKFYIKSSELPKFAALIADKGAACYDIKELTKTSETPIAKEDIPTTAFTDEDEWTVGWKKKDEDGCRFITAHYNDGTDGSEDVPIDEDGKISGPLPNIKNLCHETDYKWNTEEDGSGDEVKIATSTFSDGEKIYAQWKPIDPCYKIKLNANNGKVNGQDFIILEAKKQTPTATASTLASLPTPTRTAGGSFTFNDWKDGNKVITTSTPFEKDTEIFADWIRNPTPVIAPAIASSFSIVVNSQSLQILGASKAMPVSIYNLKGKLVLNSTATPNESISVAHLPKGVYIVKAGSKTAKFAK